MNIAITGRNVGVTESMKAYAREKIEKLRKYFERATAARATMDIVHDSHEVEIVFEVTRGVRLVGKAEAPDMYAACDLAEQKLAGQLRRFKQRLTDHHRGARRTEVDALRAGAEPAGEEAPTYEDVIDRMKHGE